MLQGTGVNPLPVARAAAKWPLPCPAPSQQGCTWGRRATSCQHLEGFRGCVKSVECKHWSQSVELNQKVPKSFPAFT